MIIFVAGPIDFWWSENWETEEHLDYMNWRDMVKTFLVEAGHLVYLPHQAFKGAWDEKAQVVNDAALAICDVFIYLTPPGVPAFGTDAEKALAVSIGKPVLHAPPADLSEIYHLTHPLDDPYGAVHRKSYGT